MPEVRLVGDWEKAHKVIEGMVNRFDQAVDTGLNRVGQIGKDQVKKGIRNQAPGGQAFTPLSEVTVLAKGSSKALIDNGDLLNSITYQADKRRKAVFVGVLRQAKNRNGDELVNIGAVHEFGVTIPVTPRMRGYLRHKLGLNLKPTTLVIRVPARPYIRPTFASRKVQGEIVNAFRSAISPVFKGETPNG